MISARVDEEKKTIDSEDEVSRMDEAEELYNKFIKLRTK